MPTSAQRPTLESRPQPPEKVTLLQLGLVLIVSMMIWDIGIKAEGHLKLGDWSSTPARAAAELTKCKSQIRCVGYDLAVYSCYAASAPQQENPNFQPAEESQ